MLVQHLLDIAHAVHRSRVLTESPYLIGVRASPRCLSPHMIEAEIGEHELKGLDCILILEGIPHIEDIMYKLAIPYEWQFPDLRP